RTALSGLEATGDLSETRAAVKELAAEHLRREESVWGELDQAPLARAVGYIAELAELTTTPAPTGVLSVQAMWHATDGHKVDDLALRAIAAATTASDRAA